MHKEKLLVVYNTCGIIKNNDKKKNETIFSKFIHFFSNNHISIKLIFSTIQNILREFFHIRKSNVYFYVKALESILKQKDCEFKLVVSSCLNTDEEIESLKEKIQGIEICRINEILPVNVTFNKTCQEYTKKYGLFDGYVYVDSGLLFKMPNILKEMSKRLETNKYGMISVTANNDSGYINLGIKDNKPPKEDYILQVGSTCNLHLVCFDNTIFKNYNQKMIPDIFSSHSTESVFPFQNKAIEQDFVICKDLMVHHKKSLDGASSGFGRNYNLFRTNKTIEDICNLPEATKVGFGHEENRGIKIHDPNAYTSEGKAKHPEELKTFINKHLFLEKNLLDYDQISINHF